ncbi:bZIP protein [Wolffia australiana]
MSRRPPRCPFQNKAAFSRAADVNLFEGGAKLHRYPSQESYFDEQPLWVDDLLGESEMSPRGALRRAASDPVAILDAISNGFREADSNQADGLSCRLAEDFHDSEEVRDGFEGSCVYGPNSPRHKLNLSQSESAIVSALWENVPQFPFQCAGSIVPGVAEVNHPAQSFGNPPLPTGDFAAERASRRHYGQRSRVRKLQYIAELERTVSVFQTLEADLAAKVASLFQRRAVLYEENNSLKQRIASLRKEKMIKDGQHQFLKNELKRMKAAVGHHRKTKSTSSFQMDSIERVSLDAATWQSLDMAKLSLG